MKKFLLACMILVLFTQCKSIIVKDKETTSRIMFKNLLKTASEINDVEVAGFVKISGVKEIKPMYIQFDSRSRLQENKAAFTMYLFKKPLLEIVLDNDIVYFINHTADQYTTLDIEQVDFSRFLGINFNPVEVSYFFLGSIPYDPEMELMDFSWDRSEYQMNITNDISKYTIRLNRDEEITSADIYNQYFDVFKLESIGYTTNDDGKNIPKSLVFATSDGDITISFNLNRISLKKQPETLFDTTLLEKYTRVESIDDITIEVGGNK
jgi:hypothetical protein